MIRSGRPRLQWRVQVPASKVKITVDREEMYLAEAGTENVERREEPRQPSIAMIEQV